MESMSGRPGWRYTGFAMLCLREASAHLRLFVKGLWIGASGHAAVREHVLPNTDMHLVFRLNGPEVRLYRDSADREGTALGFAVVGGPRSAFYVKEAGTVTCSAGVILRADAALPLFGVPPSDLVNSHARLSDLWGSAAQGALEQVQSATSPRIALARIESLLTARLPGTRAVHPAVLSALTKLGDPSSVREAVRHSGYSHRRFLELFRDTFGLSPKAYCRVQRFRRALDGCGSGQIKSLSELAITCGYSDQSHFNREFLAFTGVTPTAYRTLAPQSPNHVPINLQR